MQAEEQAFARVDALAQKAVAWVAPIRFAIAQTTAEREAVYRLRYQAVVEHRWLTPTDLPDGLEFDDYDARAVHIVAWDNKALAATSRLVFPATGLKLPTEVAYGLEIEPRGKVVDAGRFVIARAYSNIEHRLLAALLSRTWLQVRAQGYSYVCAAFASSTMVRLYWKMGVLAAPLAPPRVYWSEERYPVRFDVAQSASIVNAQWLDKIERGRSPERRVGSE
jgi:N-acyl-L-homoserine lactone synthetase